MIENADVFDIIPTTNSTVEEIRRFMSTVVHKFTQISRTAYYASDRVKMFLSSNGFSDVTEDILEKYHESISYIMSRKCTDGVINVQLLKSDFAYDMRKITEKYIKEEYDCFDGVQDNYSLVFSLLMNLGITNVGEEYCKAINELFDLYQSENI